MVCKTFDEIVEKCKKHPKTKKVAVAGAADSHVIEAVVEAKRINLVIPILIGDEKVIGNELKKINEKPETYKIVHADSAEECGIKSVELIKNNEAEFIMKGMVDTKDVLKPLVKKENNLGTGKLMNIFSYNEVPQIGKLICIADGGMIPYPTLEQKKEIIINCVDALHKLGIENPSVAVLASVEKVNPKQVETTDAAALVEMNKTGEIPGCTVVGPISFDIAMSKEIAITKKYDCKFSGEFDCLIVPTMVSGNLMNKAMVLFGNTKMAGVVVGAKVPVVLTSRGASAEEKFVSLALASLIS